MDTQALGIAAFGVVFTGIIGLFTWVLKSANEIGRAHVALATRLETVCARIDSLVLRLERNLETQVHEQLLRNTLQEKVASLERQGAQLFLEIDRLKQHRPQQNLN